jgi:ACS family hexuronate transporter-like MFS transporter
MNGQPAARPDSWRWTVCGLLLLATMLNYMDRQTLSQLITTIKQEFQLNDAQYGDLEFYFGLAFAAGAAFFGFLVDRVGPRWLYPAVLLGWSLAGLATGYADHVAAWLPDWLAGDTDPERAFHGFLVCRTALGFFEAGHWPCALVTTQVILLRKDRSFGNSILQSGASLGAIVTPQVVYYLVRNDPDNWRAPFLLIGLLGLLWVVPWLTLIRAGDLDRSPTAPAVADAHVATASWRMVVVLVVMVVTINLTWQFFRAWLPMFLEERRGYDKKAVAWFISAYYIATDVGCITVGAAVKWLAGRGWDVHRARVLTFALCTGLALLSVPVAFLPAGPLLLGLLLLVGAGTLGLFPNYYAFTQELSRTHQGKISGSLGTITWVCTGLMHRYVGRHINETKSYVAGIIMAGVVPVLALVLLLLLWPRRAAPPAPVPAIEGETVGRV